jgi:poly-gamma-glutamate synthesis protein (capsule biosynthesis protein)
MAYSSSLQNTSLTIDAQAGNFRAIAQWLNQSLMPYGMRALVGGARPGCLKILVELQPIVVLQVSEQDCEDLIRFVCHRIWRLNSAAIEGVRIALRFVGDPEILWERSVRIANPARQQKKSQSRSLTTQIRQTARRKARLKAMRVLLMSGSTVFAFVVGGILAYTKAPIDRSSAVVSPQTNPAENRPNLVRTALESIPVVKHNRVANADDPTVSMLFAGDVTLADSFADTIGKDYKRAFANMDEYRQVDLAMVNLENPLTRANTILPGKRFNFKADPDAVKVLKEGGVDLVTLANNHTMDYDEQGLLETMDTLDKAGIRHMGAGRNLLEARRPEVIDVKGQRIAYLGYYGEEYAAGVTSAGTNPILEDRIAQDIKALRSQVDWIVVNYHWGEEKAVYPADWQVQLAHFTIDQGADLVVGHHPHVLQGAEIYKGRPIAYSLGNFIFGGHSRRNYDTAVLKVAVKDKQMKVEFLPVEVQNYQPRVVSGDRGETILKQIAELSTSFPQPLTSPITLDASKPIAAKQTAPAAPVESVPTEVESAPAPREADPPTPAVGSTSSAHPATSAPATPVDSAPPTPTEGSATNVEPKPPEPSAAPHSNHSIAPMVPQQPASQEATPPQPNSSQSIDSFTSTPNHTPFKAENLPQSTTETPTGTPTETAPTSPAPAQSAPAAPDRDATAPMPTEQN